MNVGHASCFPFRAVLGGDALDRKDLEQRLKPTPAHTGEAIELDDRMGLILQRSKGLGDIIGVRDRCRSEVFPDRFVRLRRQQHRFGVLDGPTRTTDLLVVRNRRRWRTDMNAEPEIGLVVAHAERRSSNNRLHFVGPEQLFYVNSSLGLHLTCVRLHLVAARLQEPSKPVCLSDGEYVNDARPRNGVERIGHPCVARDRRQSRNHRQAQRCTRQRSAECDRAGAKLRSDIGRDSFVGRGRGCKHRCCWR